MQVATAWVVSKGSSLNCSIRITKDGDTRSWEKLFGGLDVGAEFGSWHYNPTSGGRGNLWFRDSDDGLVMCFVAIPADFLAIFCVKTYSGEGDIISSSLVVRESVTWQISDPCV